MPSSPEAGYKPSQTNELQAKFERVKPCFDLLKRLGLELSEMKDWQFRHGSKGEIIFTPVDVKEKGISSLQVVVDMGEGDGTQNYTVAVERTRSVLDGSDDGKEKTTFTYIDEGGEPFWEIAVDNPNGGNNATYSNKSAVFSESGEPLDVQTHLGGDSLIQSVGPAARDAALDKLMETSDRRFNTAHGGMPLTHGMAAVRMVRELQGLGSFKTVIVPEGSGSSDEFLIAIDPKATLQAAIEKWKEDPSAGLEPVFQEES